MTNPNTNMQAKAARQTLRPINTDKKDGQGEPSAALIAEHIAENSTRWSISPMMQIDKGAINSAVEALQMVALPSAVLYSDGRVIAVNELLKGFAPQIIIAPDDFVRFQFEPGNKLMSEALARARNSGCSVNRSFALPRNGEARPAIVHVLPVLGRAREIFISAAFLLVVTPVERSHVPAVETIKALFDLTPAEARVAHLLAGGRNIPATAKQLAVSVETIRCHVKAILSKSGMRRQTDFVAAIASVQALE